MALVTVGFHWIVESAPLRHTASVRCEEQAELGSPSNVCPHREELHMIDTREPVITEALAVIDKALAEMLRRELVSSGEVADLLLDLRSLLISNETTTVA